MKATIRMLNCEGVGRRGERGVATVELAIILPLLLMIIFAIVDIGRLLDARFAVTKLAQQGGLMGSRDLPRPNPSLPYNPVDLIIFLQKGASPLDLTGSSGKIYIWRITAGISGTPDPVITSTTTGGSLSDSKAVGSIGDGYANLGLSADIFGRLQYKTAQGMADIAEVTVVEVFYKYQLITPLARFIPGLPIVSGGGFIISSKAVFP
jgi:hypothetical protein